MLAVVAAAGLTLGLSSPATASVAVDAQVAATVPTAFNSVMTFKTMAQTFTAVHSGQLTEVDVYAGMGNFANTLKVQVWNVQAGVPFSAATSVTVADHYGFTPDWHPVVLTTRVPVQAGQQYAIVAVAGLANYLRWGYNGTAGYAPNKMLVLSGSTWAQFTTLPSGSAFNFKTFVETSSGPALSIAPSTSAASAPEGAAATMNGTFQGNVGAVTLAADHGTVAPGATAGTWKWTGDVYDEANAAPAAITVTVTDSTGAAKSTTFSLTITGVKPTAGISAGATRQATSASTTASLATPEGSSLTLNGWAKADDPSDQAGVFIYTWNATKNGAALAPSTGGSYTVSTSDEDTFVVSMTATDDGGMTSDPVSVTVVGAEIQPTATITSISVADPALTFVAPQATLNFAGSYVDPAPEAHTFRWDFGDGGSSTSLSASHAYAAGGTYTVRLTVKDDEGVAGFATATVKVLNAQQALASMVAYVQGLSSLNKGQQNSLVAKLNAAADSIARGNNNAAHNQLNAFINELDADLKTGKVSNAAYNSLRADAHAIQGSIGTYNRFVEWWPLPA